MNHSLLIEQAQHNCPLSGVIFQGNFGSISQNQTIQGQPLLISIVIYIIRMHREHENVVSKIEEENGSGAATPLHSLFFYFLSNTFLLHPNAPDLLMPALFSGTLGVIRSADNITGIYDQLVVFAGVRGHNSTKSQKILALDHWSFTLPAVVAVVKWVEGMESISLVIGEELSRLGYEIALFHHSQPLPKKADFVLTFGPYGDILNIGKKIAADGRRSRPTWAHWNTEGMRDLRLPLSVVRPVGTIRSWLGRIFQVPANGAGEKSAYQARVGALLASRMLRFRYVGDYFYLFRTGWLKVLADSSVIYAERYRSRGIPVVFAPWGMTPGWYEDLDLERDIDVLWMGVRGTRRRGTILDTLRRELEPHGIKFYFADNLETPFVWGVDRTRLLNRAKITLNITRTWFDDNFSRFSLAAPNRSFFLSETLQPHCPPVVAGEHYISVGREDLAAAILQYLENGAARRQIVENAYRLVMTELTLRNSLKNVMRRAEFVREGVLT